MPPVSNKGKAKKRDDPLGVRKSKKDDIAVQRKKLEERKAALKNKKFDTTTEKQEALKALKDEEDAVDKMEMDDNESIDSDEEHAEEPSKDIPVGTSERPTSQTSNSTESTVDGVNEEVVASTGSSAESTPSFSTTSRASPQVDTPASETSASEKDSPKQNAESVNDDNWLQRVDAALAKLRGSKTTNFDELRAKEQQAEDNLKRVWNEVEQLPANQQHERQQEFEHKRRLYGRAVATVKFAELNRELEVIESDDIANGVVCAKHTAGFGSKALVKIGRDKAAVYRIVSKKSVDQTQWNNALEFSVIRPETLSPAEANNIIGVAFVGGSETLTPEYNVKHELRPVKPKPEDPTSRLTTPRMWIYGQKASGEFWLLARTYWARIASRQPNKATEIALGIASRQQKFFILDLMTGRTVDLDSIVGEDRRPLREQTASIDDETQREIPSSEHMQPIDLERSPEPENNASRNISQQSTERSSETEDIESQATLQQSIESSPEPEEDIASRNTRQQSN
ncbi:hypothetical protein ACMFMG_011724 [Clarireedia jacksonii]